MCSLSDGKLIPIWFSLCHVIGLQCFLCRLHKLHLHLVHIVSKPGRIQALVSGAGESNIFSRTLKKCLMLFCPQCSSTLATTFSSGTPGHDESITTVDQVKLKSVDMKGERVGKDKYKRVQHRTPD